MSILQGKMVLEELSMRKYHLLLGARLRPNHTAVALRHERGKGLGNYDEERRQNID